MVTKREEAEDVIFMRWYLWGGRLIPFPVNRKPEKEK